MQMLWDEKSKYPATKGDVIMLIEVEAKRFGEKEKSFNDCMRFCDRIAELRKGLEEPPGLGGLLSRKDLIMTQYANDAEECVKRIIALIPEHPEILEMSDPFPLFKVEGFKCDDLGLSLFQASWALRAAKERYR